MTALPDTAEDIVTRMLDATGRAIMNEDFNAFARHFMLPHTVTLFEGSVDIHTPVDLKALFDTVRTRITDLRVTDMIRYCEAAQFVRRNHIVTTHVSHLMRGEIRVVDPYPCIGQLHLIDGRWQIGDSQYAMPDTLSIERLFDAIKAKLITQIDSGSHLTLVPKAEGA